MAPETELLTVEEVAERLRLSAEAVRRLLRTRQLAGYKFGKAYRVRPEDVDAFLSRARREAAPDRTRETIDAD